MGENLLNNASTKKDPISNLHLWFTISVSQFYYKHNIFQEFVNIEICLGLHFTF